MDAVQLIVNLMVPLILAWATWLTKTVIAMGRDTDKCQSTSAETLKSHAKEMDRLASEIIISRNGYSELASALARLSAQTEMVLVLLEQLKTEVRKH